MKKIFLASFILFQCLDLQSYEPSRLSRRSCMFITAALSIAFVNHLSSWLNLFNTTQNPHDVDYFRQPGQRLF